MLPSWARPSSFTKFLAPPSAHFAVGCALTVIIGPVVVAIYLALSYEKMLRRGSDAIWVRLVGFRITAWILLALFCLARRSTKYIFQMDSAAKKVKQRIEQGVVEVVPNGVCFIGGSMFTYWRHLQKDMFPLAVCNVAFGGARIPDAVRHLNLGADTSPKLVVYSCVLTDLIVFNRTPNELRDGFRVLVHELREKHKCEAPVVYVR